MKDSTKVFAIAMAGFAFAVIAPSVPRPYNIIALSICTFLAGMLIAMLLDHKDDPD